MILVNEIFYSLQGEGRLAGVPSVFVRIAGCPLNCRWCDTKYARAESAGRKCAIEEVKKEVLGRPTRYAVVTGGEPMVCDGLAELVEGLSKARMHVTIETSGVEFVPDLKCDLMSISPKLSNSIPADSNGAKEHKERCFNADAIRRLMSGYDYQLKFVVDTPADLDEIAGCIEQIKSVDPYKVFLMPQATTRRQLIEKSQMLAEYCLRTGFAMSQRLQVMLWEGQRGR